MATMWTFGAAFGVAVHFFSNQMRKVPFTHRAFLRPPGVQSPAQA